MTLSAALDYCARGWPVLPLWPVHRAGLRACLCVCRAGAGCEWPGKHPACAGGASSATTDAARVTRFWDAFTRRYDGPPGVGIATGGAAGLVVVDVDTRHTGDEAWARLVERDGRGYFDTVTALTPGGVHLYFRHAGAVPSSVGRLGPGLDVRASGGYVVAPPTLHETGRLYMWEASSDPTDGAEVAPAPAWLVAAAREPSRVEVERGAVLRAGLEPGSVGAGERNATLARVACSLRARGLDLAQLAEALRAVNATACAEPLGRREVERIARGVVRRYGAGWSPAVQARAAADEDAYQRAMARQGYYPHKADPAALRAGLDAPTPRDPMEGAHRGA